MAPAPRSVSVGGADFVKDFSMSDTQQPPPAEPDKGAASPVSPTGTEPAPVEPVEPEKNPLANSNVAPLVGNTIPPAVDVKRKPE